MGLDQELEIRYKDKFSKKLEFRNERELHDILESIYGEEIKNNEIIVFPESKLLVLNEKLKNLLREDPWYLSNKVQRLFCYLQLLNQAELNEVVFLYYSSF